MNKIKVKSLLIGGTMGLILALCGELSRRPEGNIYDPKPVEVSAVGIEVHKTPTPTTTTAAATTAAEETTTEQETTQLKLCDVPLSTEFQTWLFDYCNELHISPYLIIAICERESDFNENCIYDNGNSIGIMQIQPRWHYERMERLGVDDLTDAKQNIIVGVDYLIELFNKRDNLSWVLMAYNGGEAYANRLTNNGVVSDYALSVIDRAHDLESR